MNRKNLILLLTLSAFYIGSKAFARSPAVEPVRGISIDDQKSAPKDQATGFDFRSQKKAPERKPNTFKRIEPVRELQAKDLEESDAKGLGFYFLIALTLSLPYLIWFALMKILLKSKYDDSPNIIQADFNKEDKNKDWPEAS